MKVPRFFIKEFFLCQSVFSDIALHAVVFFKEIPEKLNMPIIRKHAVNPWIFQIQKSMSLVNRN